MNVKEALQVACPRCGVAVGEKCVSLRGGRPLSTTHTARYFTYLGKPMSPRWLPSERTPKPPSKLAQERALADDLADVLSRMVVGWEPIIGHDLAQHPDVQRVMASYREARGR
jgi:hypothetical protein